MRYSEFLKMVLEQYERDRRPFVCITAADVRDSISDADEADTMMALKHHLKMADEVCDVLAPFSTFTSKVAQITEGFEARAQMDPETDIETLVYLAKLRAGNCALMRELRIEWIKTMIVQALQRGE